MKETATRNTIRTYIEKSIEIPVKNILHEKSAKIIVQKSLEGTVKKTIPRGTVNMLVNNIAYEATAENS